MYETAILRALQNAVTAAVAASTSPTLPVAYVSVGFTKPNDFKWLEVVHIPNNRTGDFLGQEKNYQGLMRLILHWPKNGAAAYTPLDLLGSITDYFTNGRMLSGVQIVGLADYLGTIEVDDHLGYSASIQYASYRP